MSAVRSTSTLAWIRRGATANLALPLAALATSPILARALGADGRGALAAVTIPVLLASSTLTLGLPEALTLHLARGGVTAAQVRRLALHLPLLIGVVVAAGGWFLMPLLLHQYPEHVTVARLVFLTMPLVLVIQNARGAALGVLAYRAVFRERYLSALLRLVPLVVLLLAGALTVSTAAAVAVLAGVASAVVLGPPFRRALAGTDRPAFEPEEAPGHAAVAPRGESLPRVLHSGLLMWVGTVAQLFTLRFDQLVLAAAVEPAALGAYVVAVSLAEVANSLTAAVREVLFARAGGRDDPALVARGCRLAVAVGVAFAVVASAAVQVGLVPVFGPDFAPAVALTQILLVASIGSGLGGVLGVGLAVTGRAGTWSTVQVLGMVAIVALTLPVVHVFGVLGAAWLSLAVYLATGAAGVRCLSRVTGVPGAHYLVPRREDLEALRRR